MTERMNLCSPRPKKDGGTFWFRIGTAFPDDNGGFSLIFDALPLQDNEGRCIVKAFKQNEGGGQSGQRGGYSKPASSGAPAEDEDSIPFSPEFR
jgi:hypothetical protein